MRLFRFLFIGVIATALLGACGQPAAQPEPSATPAASGGATDTYPGPATGGAYPGPTTAAGSAYPGPGGEPATPTIDTSPLVVPEPASDQVGVVTGTIYRVDEAGQREPIRGVTLYLGTILRSTDGVEAMVQMDRSTSPQAVTNGLGQFAFVDVAPERYGLMLDAIEGTVLLNNPEDGSDFVIEVVGGQTTDLGELAYPLPDLL